jgi:WD40 repeat protein
MVISGGPSTSRRTGPVLAVVVLALLASIVGGMVVNILGADALFAGDDSVAAFTDDRTTNVKQAAFSPDGRTVAVGGVECVGQSCGILGDLPPGTSSSVRFWDVTSRRPAGAPLNGHVPDVGALAYSPDGHLIATADGAGDVWLWDQASRRKVGTVLSGTAPDSLKVTSLAFSPDGHLLAVARYDQSSVLLWDVTRREAAGTVNGIRAWALAFSPDGRILASGGNDPGEVRLWDTTSHIQLGDALPVPAVGLAFSPDGRTLATVAGEAGGYLRTAWLWDAASHRQVGQLTAPESGGLFSVAYSPDGRLLATGGDSTIRFWNAATRQPVGAGLSGHLGPVNSVAFSPDGHLLASGGTDGSARLWKVPG